MVVVIVYFGIMGSIKGYSFSCQLFDKSRRTEIDDTIYFLFIFFWKKKHISLGKAFRIISENSVRSGGEENQERGGIFMSP